MTYEEIKQMTHVEKLRQIYSTFTPSPRCLFCHAPLDTVVAEKEKVRLVCSKCDTVIEFNVIR